jgi:probable addiction module antidote protein
MKQATNEEGIRFMSTSNDGTVQYLNAALHAGDATAFLVALRKGARVQGMSRVAKSGQLNRENLYRMLSADGNPTLSNLFSVISALGLELNVNWRDAKPEEFKASGRTAELWDGHGDSSDLTRHIKSRSLKRRAGATALQPSLAKRLRHCARQQGISFETLINLWLSEKLIQAGQ